MTKLQPIMFGLQASEKELPQLLPQLLQNPLFNQTSNENCLINGTSVDELFHSGCIRLGVPVDTVILHLLHSHCAKSAKQAEKLMEASETKLTSHQPHSTFSMPPMIFQSVLQRSQMKQNCFPGLGSVSELAPPPVQSLSANISSSSVVSTSNSSVSNTRSDSQGSIFSISSVEGESVEKTSPPTTRSLSTEAQQGSEVKRATMSQKRVRKDSRVLQRPRIQSTKSESEVSSDESFLQRMKKGYVPDKSTWHVCNPDPHDMLIGMYGVNSYPLLLWDPKLKVDLRLSSSLGLLSGSVTGIDPSKPTVTVKVVNSLPFKIAFSITSHRQSTTFKSHVVCPAQGLVVLEPYQTWEDNADFFPHLKDRNEYFIIDLLVCSMDGVMSWNIIRRFAVMKAAKKYEMHVALHMKSLYNVFVTAACSYAPGMPRRPSKKSSNFQLPGTRELKVRLHCVHEYQVNLWGARCTLLMQCFGLGLISVVAWLLYSWACVNKSQS